MFPLPIFLQQEKTTTTLHVLCFIIWGIMADSEVSWDLITNPTPRSSHLWASVLQSQEKGPVAPGRRCKSHEGALIPWEKDTMTIILIIEVPPPSAPKLKLKQSGEISMAPFKNNRQIYKVFSVVMKNDLLPNLHFHSLLFIPRW